MCRTTADISLCQGKKEEIAFKEYMDLERGGDVGGGVFFGNLCNKNIFTDFHQNSCDKFAFYISFTLLQPTPHILPFLPLLPCEQY